MQDFENIQSQLAQEEAALAATNEQIEAAQQAIADAHAQIEAVQARIQGFEEQIDKLREHAESVQKRIQLLREYMEMAASSRVPTPPPAPAPQRTTPPPSPAPQPATPDVSPAPEPATGDSGLDDELLPDLNQPDELGLGDALDLPAATPTAPSATDRSDITFETMDEEMLTHELLPRTSTFEEELLLLMAYHRKAIKPKEIASRFKRLDYTPKVSTTEKNIRLQVEADHHFFENVADDRIALTDEGREEAQRLLETLL